MNTAWKLIIAGAGIAGTWWMFHRRPAFVVLIRNGTVRVSKGQVTQAFLAELNDECRRSGLVRGVVQGVRKGNQLSLRFSRNIPQQCRQHLRNVWQLTD